jgi:hypothetical protein
VTEDPSPRPHPGGERGDFRGGVYFSEVKVKARTM